MKFQIIDKFEKFIPDNFKTDPFAYFESHGKAFRTGDKLVDETGVVQDDPGAVRAFPAWRHGNESLHVVAKIVNRKKAKQLGYDDDLHEWKVLVKICEMGLPCAQPVGWVEQNGEYLILTEKIEGLHFERFKDLDPDTISKFHEAMEEIKKRFEEHGVERNWYLKDMVVVYNKETGEVEKIVPTDWERTKIIES